MPKKEITSLHSPQVARVKALLGSRGKKSRNDTSEFVVDNLQSLISALSNKDQRFPLLKALFATTNGLDKLKENGSLDPETIENLEIFIVSESLMREMSDVDSSVGVLGICEFSEITLLDIKNYAKRIAYFWQIQDPGNAGTVIRSADASGFDAVIFSDQSVDIYSPKVVRSTVGSLWHLPVIADVSLEAALEFGLEHQFKLAALDSHGEVLISNYAKSEKIVLIFGNEARGLPEIPAKVEKVKIPMKGKAESFNVASAATIAMYEVGLR